MSLLDELVPKIKPYVLGWISDAQASAIGAHDLGGKLHSGTLLDSQAPQFMKMDGSRSLIGNLTVLDGITIDGIDISAHASDIAAHHEPVTILDSATIDFGLSGQQVTGSVIQSGLDHGSIGGLGDDDHPQYFNTTRHTLAVHSGLGLAINSVEMIAGNGLTGGGTLAANRTFNVGAGNGISVAADAVGLDLAYAPTWAAIHTFNEQINASSILPRATDAYDLGSTARLWRKIYASEFDTILLAQNTMSVIGGWLVIGKGEGTVVSDVAAGSTSIDFGQAMTVGHIVLFRSFGQVEYMSIGSLVSGTTYNVTRNLDGSGANAWPAGSVFLVLGTSGDGRIELNAYDTPRISILEQGATYGAQTERIRIGDLASWQGAGLTGMGIAIGDYAGNEYLAYSPGGGLLVRGTIRADDGFLGALDVSGKLSLSGANGALAIGAVPPTSATTGTGLWLDRTGLYAIESDSQEVVLNEIGLKWAKESGVFKAQLSSTGIEFQAPASFSSDLRTNIKWLYGAAERFVVGGIADGTIGQNGYGYISAIGDTSWLTIDANSTNPGVSGWSGTLSLHGAIDESFIRLRIHEEASAPTLPASEVYLFGNANAAFVDLLANNGTIIRANHDKVNSKSQALLGVNGLVSYPSLAWLGDENTGIFRPAADTVAIAAGGNEMMSISQGATVMKEHTSSPSSPASGYGALFIRDHEPLWKDSSGKVRSLENDLPVWFMFQEVQFFMTGQRSLRDSDGTYVFRCAVTDKIFTNAYINRDILNHTAPLAVAVFPNNSGAFLAAATVSKTMYFGANFMAGAWINIASLSHINTIYYWGTTNDYVWLYVDTNGSVVCRMKNAAGTAFTRTTPASTIAINTWYHIHLYYYGNASAYIWKIYVDGVNQTLTGTGGVYDSFRTATGSFAVGNTVVSGSSSNYLDGKIALMYSCGIDSADVLGVEFYNRTKNYFGKNSS